MSDTGLKRLERIGWVGIVILTVMGSAGALGHILDGFITSGDIPLVRDANVALFGQEFFQHWLNFRTYPVARMAHMLPGLLYMLLAPLQFSASLRRRRPRLHRIIGRTVLALSVGLIPSGMIFAFAHPYVGFREQVPAVFYTCLYLGFITFGLRAIFARDFLAHREWMIRAYSMGLGIYAIRVWYSLFLHLSDQPSTEFFDTAFWIGIATNLILAEIWINLSRESVAGSARPELRAVVGSGATTVTASVRPRPTGAPVGAQR